MKLPTRQIGGVQEKVSVDPGVYKQHGEAVGGALDTGSKLAGEMMERVADEAVRAAILESTQEHAKLVEDFGHKRSFTYQEVKDLKLDLSDEVTHRKIRRSDNTEASIAREEIPAEDVWPALMLRNGRGVTETQAKTIPGGGRRKQFEQRQEALLVEQYGREVTKSVDARERKQLSQYERDIANAESAGTYAVAMQLVREHPILTEEEKDLEIIRLLQAEESRFLFNKKRNGSDAELQEQIKRLERSDYGQDKDGDLRNSMTQAQREAEIGSMNAVLAARERDRKTDSANEKGAWWNNFLKGVDDEKVSAAELMLEIDRVASTGLLTGAQIVKARDLAKGGAHNVTAQNKRYSTLRSQATSDDVGDREKFMNLLLGEEAINLSPDQLTALDKLQQDMKTDRSGYRSQEDMRKISLGMAKLHKPLGDMKDADYKLIDQFDRAVDATLAAIEKKEGREATPNEIQSVMDEAYATILMTKRKADSGAWYKWNKTLTEYGVTQEFIDNAYRWHAKKGKPMPTPDWIYEQWQIKQKQN